MNALSTTESVFVEEVCAHARAAARPAPVEGDPEAEALLASARRNIYHWPESFGGFRAFVAMHEGAEAWSGPLTAEGSRRYTLDMDAPAERWARTQIEELIAHREAPTVSRMILKSGATLGDWDATYGRQVFLVNDPMRSFYRIKDRRITQIGRHYKGQVLIINIDQHLEHQGRCVSRAYSAFYWSMESGALVRTETYLDDYQEVGGLLLPASRRYVNADASGCLARRLEFHGVTPL